MDWPVLLTLLPFGVICFTGATGGFEHDDGWFFRVLRWRRQPKPTEWERLRTLRRQLRVEEAADWQRQFDALCPPPVEDWYTPSVQRLGREETSSNVELMESIQAKRPLCDAAWEGIRERQGGLRENDILT